MHPAFQQPRYLIKRQFLKLFGGAFRVYDPSGQLVLYSRMKSFTLREDIRLYTAEDMREEVLTIRARQIIDFACAYDVVDPADGTRVGALRRKGLRSLLRDEWLLLDEQDRELGKIREDSMGLALLRRFLTNLVPQTYLVTMGTEEVARFAQTFNPFLMRLEVTFAPEARNVIDRRLALAAAILLCAIEGRQN